MAGELVVAIGEEGGSPSMFFVVSWARLSCAVEAGPSTSVRLPARGVSGSCTRFAGSLLDDFVFASVWDPLSVATAVGDIVAGAVGGVVLVMMHSNARRSVLRPFGYLGFGITDIAGGLGRLLGGVPIAILSANFR